MFSVPSFSVAFWNAWPLTLFVIVHPLLMQLVDKVAGIGDLNRKKGDVPLKDGEKKPVPIPTLLLIGLFILSIFIPLRLGTLWFYLGLTVFFRNNLR